jgi:enoyl-CoA hydratase
MSNSVLVEEIQRKIIVRFNRPEIRSPLSVEVLERLAAILDEIEGRESVEALIFTGADDVFASGADLREIAQLDPASAVSFGLRGQR